jgi:hypothetical protein
MSETTEQPLVHATPDSSMTSYVRYSAKDKVLTLNMRTGKPIHLANVPQEHFDAIKSAPSAGKYYHAHLKGKFSPAA